MPDVGVMPDSNLAKALRLIGSTIGTNNPTADALASLTPMQPGSGGGVIGTAQRLQQLQHQLQQLGITS